MAFKICQNSFSKGILSPSLQGRVDLAQYSNGLKKLNNGIILQEGCVINRSGLEYVGKCKYPDKKTRLIPFIFGLDENYIIEFGDKYLRFIKDGGYLLGDDGQILELTSPYTEDELGEIDYVQQLNTMTLVHKNHKIQELTRTTSNWQIKEITIAPSINPPTNLTISYQGDIKVNTKTYNYVVCSVHKKTNEESHRSAVVSVVAHKEAYWTTSEYVTLNWNGVADAVEYNIYKSVNGIFGYVGTSSTTSFVDDNIDPDLTTTAPIYVNPFENENPSCVSIFQQRKVYASSSLSPQTIWASQSGCDNNFNISRPLLAINSIEMTMCDNVASKIQYLLPFDDLIALTTNSEWAINGSDGVFSANPAPVANLQSYYGSAKIKPVVSGSMVIFVQSGGNIVRDLGYNYLSDSYDGEELSLFASHLFEDKKIVSMAYAKEPYRILWCVMDDGTLCALTYNPTQKIACWHTHSTKGKFEDVCTIRENNTDICYFVVKRTINGEDVKYIERFKQRSYKSVEDSFLLDCAIKTEFDNKVSHISGLNHLKGEKVMVLADCGVVENVLVNENGEINLPYAAKNVLVGLPFEFELETLNIEGENTFGLKKIVNSIDVKILNSREDFFIKNDDNSLAQNYRSLDSINNSAKLFTKTVKFTPLSESSEEKSIKIVQKYPLPLNIIAINCSMTLEDNNG